MVYAAQWCQAQTNTCNLLCNNDTDKNSCAQVSHSLLPAGLPVLARARADRAQSRRTSSMNAHARPTPQRLACSTTRRPCPPSFAMPSSANATSRTLATQTARRLAPPTSRTSVARMTRLRRRSAMRARARSAAPPRPLAPPLPLAAKLPRRPPRPASLPLPWPRRHHWPPGLPHLENDFASRSDEPSVAPPGRASGFVGQPDWADIVFDSLYPLRYPVQFSLPRALPHTTITPPDEQQDDETTRGLRYLVFFFFWTRCRGGRPHSLAIVQF